ncbi:MAG TPA: pyrroloquinoline quinone-dependent dehydrogenase [Burkholderiales bacterium]|nr:pyrroloquinoline quinone-dependent dehydrogenase [Burkholderiales bacterium]
MRRRRILRIAFFAVAVSIAAQGLAGSAAEPGWPAYGADQGGTRYSAAREITPENVDNLRQQWVYRTGDAQRRAAGLMKRIKFETTPILVEDKLVLCTPFSEVIALEPERGTEVWRHNPEVATDRRPANRYNCRGVAAWRDPVASPASACALRIFAGTVDARVIALDAQTGAPCRDFGSGGEVVLGTEPLEWPGEFQISSAPVVANGVVIVGSSINDNGRVAAPSGRVRAFDARSGALRWTWDPIPRTAADLAAQTWGDGWRTTGAANVWAPMSIDEARGLVFLPTSSPSPDFYGGLRPGSNRHADSVAAVRIDDGALVWSFQIVKHDVWDYDLPAQPTLATLALDGVRRDVVIQATKQGLLFVLDRDTGKPVFPVEERAVPQGGVDGETLAPTQTFPADLPALVPNRLRPDDAFGFTTFDRNACRKRIAALRSDGLYTPPSTQGTILFPMTGGGVNWGGVAVDPNGVVFVNTTRAPHVVTLIPREDYERVRAANPGKEVSPQRGAPFGMKREVLLSPFGVPCNAPPWGTIAALDLESKRIVWESRLGTTEDLTFTGIALHTGTPTLGGPVATAGGVVFIGAAMDRYLRAFDAKDGRELWSGRLPAPGIATPMTYVWKGRQYVVVAAGGHAELGTRTADAIVAFALPRPGEAGRSAWDRTIDQPGGRFRAGIVGLVLVIAALGGGGYAWRKRRALRRT